MCSFSSADGVAVRVSATYVSRTLCRCTSPAIRSALAVDYVVRLSLNGQQFSTQSLLDAAFGYHPASIIGGFSPSSGPVEGDTLVVVHGVHLSNGSDYRCRFGTLIVAATHSQGRVTCVAPYVNAAVSMHLEVSQNGQQFTQSAQEYSFHGPSAVSMLRPVAGPAAGDSLVAIHGSALLLGSDYRCRFGSYAGILASVFNGTLVTCRSPAVWTGTEPVTLSLNGQQYLKSSANFTFFELNRVVRLSPSTGSSVGGTVVTLTGQHFRTFTQHPIACRFGEALAPTSFVDQTTLRCQAPPATLAGLAKSVWLDFEDISKVTGELLGCAQVVDGFLELTPAEHFQTGSFVLDLGTRLRPFRWFQLHVLVTIRDGPRSLLTPVGGLGWSLNFGPLPAAPFGETGCAPLPCAA